MKKSCIAILFLCYSLVLYSQGKDSLELDKTALLLGMINYPRLKIDIPPHNALLYSFDEKENATFFIKTLKEIDSIKFSALTIDRKSSVLRIRGEESALEYFDSYLNFIPCTRKEALKEEFQNEEVLEGYINPYKFSLKQQKSFLLGLTIEKGKKNNDFEKQFYHMGIYNINVAKSKMFYDIIISFMNNSSFEIVSSTIKQNYYDENGVEHFFGTVSFNVPEKYQRYIDEIQNSRKLK